MPKFEFEDEIRFSQGIGFYLRIHKSDIDRKILQLKKRYKWTAEEAEEVLMDLGQMECAPEQKPKKEKK